MIADVAIHAPGKNSDPRNFHAHILLTMREIGPDGFGKKVREWNSREQLEHWREQWEKIQNRYLERHGHAARVDRRTLEAQGIDREPTTHRGPHVDAMQRKGIDTERGAAARETFYRNLELARLKRELADVQRQIAAAEHTHVPGPSRDDPKRGQARKFDWKGRNILDFDKTARETTRPERKPEPPENLHGAAADIWRSWHHAHNARAFAYRLQQHGISLAAVSRDEADSSRRDAAFAREKGHFIPEYREGEIVAVTERGHVYRLNSRTTGDDTKDIAKFLRKLDRSQLQSVGETKQTMHEQGEQRVAELQAFRDLLRDSRAADRLKEAQKPGWQGRDGKRRIDLSPRAINRPVRTAGKAFEGAAKLVEGLFFFLSPAPPKTPEQIAVLGKQAERERRQEWEREHHRKQRDRDR
jgi:hypothetical protein